MYRPKDPEGAEATWLPAFAAADAGPSLRPSLIDELDIYLARRERTRDDMPAPAADHGPARAASSAKAAAAAGRQPAPDERPAALNAVINAQFASLSSIGPGDVLTWLGRGLGWIVLATLLGIAAAYGYSAIATPRYTVYTDIIIDPQNLNVLSDDVFQSTPQRDSQILEVESKLKVLTSRNVLKQVIADLNLTEDEEFTRPSPLAPLLNLISADEPQGDPELGVLRELDKRVQARREERSYVVSLAVWTEDPEKSVRLSQAIFNAFELELFNAAAASAGRVAATLNGRLDELRAAVTEAEEKVERFKRDNGIQESNTGELASSRISSALDTQVLEAQQRLIQSESRYTLMRSAIAGRRTATASVFDSTGMQTLRTSYNTIRQEIGAQARTLGERHPRLVALQAEQRTVEQAIADEANRIFETARTEMEEARSTLSQLRRRADSERSTVFTNNDAQVRLRELTRDARAKAAVYETYLGRSHQITERQQIDTSNVRVISPPVPPKTKSWPPRKVILLAAGAVAGLMLGTGLALLSGLLRHMAAARRRLAARPAQPRQA